MDSTRKKAEAVGEGAERRKRNDYQFLAGNYLFAPLAFEATGVWGLTAKDIFQNISQYLDENNSCEPLAFEYLQQKISNEIQRGNAACILSTTGNVRELEEVFRLLAVQIRLCNRNKMSSQYA